MCIGGDTPRVSPCRLVTVCFSPFMCLGKMRASCIFREGPLERCSHRGGTALRIIRMRVTVFTYHPLLLMLMLSLSLLLFLTLLLLFIHYHYQNYKHPRLCDPFGLYVNYTHQVSVEVRFTIKIVKIVGIISKLVEKDYTVIVFRIVLHL